MFFSGMENGRGRVMADASSSRGMTCFIICELLVVTMHVSFGLALQMGK
jgi:hypothetical protein